MTEIITLYQVYAPRYSYQAPEEWITLRTPEEAQRLVDAINSGKAEGVENAFWESLPVEDLPKLLHWEVNTFFVYAGGGKWDQVWQVFISADEYLVEGEIELITQCEREANYQVCAATAKEALELAQAHYKENIEGIQ